MDVKEDIVNFIQGNGPSTPIQVSKEIKMDSLFVSAHLSEMAANKKLKISSLKVGSTSLYYIPGQENQLENFVDSLNEKDKKTFSLLREKSVLREKEVDPLTRVSLKNIKDFAVPLKVSYGQDSEVFWKFYSLSNQDSEAIIKKQLSNKSDNTKTGERKQEIPKPTPETQKQRHEEKEIHVPSLEEKQKKPIDKKPVEKQLNLKPKKETPKLRNEAVESKFLDEIINYFNQKKIIVIEKDIIRKNSEIDFTIRVPSAVGSLIYYCKAKNKKRINEGDLSSTFITAQSKKLPVLFLTKGELTKRAKDMLEKEFQGMGVKKI